MTSAPTRLVQQGHARWTDGLVLEARLGHVPSLILGHNARNQREFGADLHLES